MILVAISGNSSGGGGWTNPEESVNVWWMSARAAQRQGDRKRTSHHPRQAPEQLQRDNKRLERQVEHLRRKVADQEQQLTEHKKQIADLEGEKADLERQLAARKKNSTTSSKPPSSDGVAGASRPRLPRKKSKRKPGGQPGHPGKHRPLVPPEQVQEVKPVLPEACQGCGHRLPPQPDQAETVGDPQRRQVTELPPIQPYVIEYQCLKVLCPECGEATRAPLPEDAQGQFGPRLTALIVYLTVVCRMPRRVVEGLLVEALGISISLGSTQKCWEEASAAVATPCQQLAEQLQQQPVLNVDETGWRTNGEKRYLWAFVAPLFVYYTVARKRSSAILLQVLGEVFDGVLCSDRFSAYLKYHQGKAQFCWAHLKRNILGVLEFTKNSATERFCRDALALHARLFRLWHKFRSELIDRQELLLRSIRLQEQFFALAERNLDSQDDEVRNLATALFEHCGRLFTFLEEEGVEPTNNSAEQALRIGVQWRKIVFGNRSANGELATARLLTVTQTCRQQGRNSLQYLHEAIRCHRRRQRVPSLLPEG